MPNVKNLRSVPVEASSESSSYVKPRRLRVKSDADPFKSVLGQHFDPNPNTAKLMLIRISQKHGSLEEE